MVSRNGEWILVIGHRSPLVEGVHDLLQVVGYRVDMSASWAAAEHALDTTPPNLVIVDLSSAVPDTLQLAEEIRAAPQWSQVPILFVSFSGDDRIRDLQQHNRDQQLHFYSHTLLSMDELLEKVRACMA